MTKKLKPPCIVLFLMGILCSISYSAELTTDEFLQKLDQGFIAAQFYDPAQANSFNKDISTLPGYSYFEKIKTEIKTRMAENTFPVIEKGSRMDECLPDLCRSSLSCCGFEPEGFYLERMGSIFKIDKSIDFSYFPHYAVQLLMYDIERGKSYEKIFPDENQVKIINQQVSELKSYFKQILLDSFPELSQKQVEEWTDIPFIPFVKGPRSVQTLKAKRPLKPEQITLIHKKWDELTRQKGITLTERLANKVKRFVYSDKPDDLNPAQLSSILFPFARDYTRVLMDEFYKVLPKEYVDIPRPRQLDELITRYAADTRPK